MPKVVKKFKLLRGQHVQADKSQPVDEKTKKHPSVTYKAGDFVEADYDLAEKHGHEKFQFVSEKQVGDVPAIKGDPVGGMITPSNPNVTPNGQVTTGHQQTTGTPEGGAVAGATNTGLIPPDPAKLVKPEQAKPVQQPPKLKRDLEKDYEGFKGLSVKDLQEIAESEEIDLGNATKREDIIAKLKAASK